MTTGPTKRILDDGRTAVRVVWAGDLDACECCGEPWCDDCSEHYADCACPGPTSEFEFVELDGAMWAVEGTGPDDETPGERFRREEPDWPHECCYPGTCQHRTTVDDVKRCESPSECDYLCQRPTETT